MRVIIEARSLRSRGGGVTTYTRELVRHLLSLDGEYTLLYDQAQGRGVPGAQELVVKRGSDILLPFWLQWQVPRALSGQRVDLVHFTKADVPRRKIAPVVVTIFDVIPLLFPESQTMTRRWYWPGALKRAAKYSDHIITISQASKRDIVKHLKVAPDKITVTSPAVDLRYFKPRSGERPPEPYILFVGTRDKRKNVGALLRAFASIADDVPHKLLIAGKAALKPDQAEAEAARLGIEDRAEFRDYVAYSELPVLYAGADLLVWPSVYEGWGFPPQEAMACGTPVIVSDGGALPEVVGEAAEIVRFTKDDLEERTHDEEFERDLAIRMKAVLSDEARRAQLRQKGLEQVKQFSWEQVAKQTREVYQSVLTSVL